MCGSGASEALDIGTLETSINPHLPHFDGLVPGGAYNEIALWHKSDRADVVIVPVHCLNTGKRLLKVPQFDGHVRTAGDQQLPGSVKCDILNTVRVPFERALKLSTLEIPDLEKKSPVYNLGSIFLNNLRRNVILLSQPQSIKLTLSVASSLAETIRLNTGWKMTRFTGALCPERQNFSGGLGIHSVGDLFPRVGAPSINSFSASESLDSSSITCSRGIITFASTVQCGRDITILRYKYLNNRAVPSSVAL